MKCKGLLPVLICVLCIPLGLIAQAGPLKLKVVTDQANIREEPDIGSPILHMVPRGTVLDGESKEGEWYRVSFVSDRGEMKTGYVHESLVIVTSRLPEAKKPEAPPAEPPPPPVKVTPVPPEKERPPREAAPPAREQRTETEPQAPPAARRRPQLRFYNLVCLIIKK